MANTRYPTGLQALTQGDVDFIGDTISMEMYSGAAIYDPAHQFLDDVAGTPSGSPVDLTILSNAGGVIMATVPPFTPAAATSIVVVMYVNTGSPASSQLLAWLDSKADGTPLAIDGDGSTPFTLNWTGPVYSIGGL